MTSFLENLTALGRVQLIESINREMIWGIIFRILYNKYQLGPNFVLESEKAVFHKFYTFDDISKSIFRIFEDKIDLKREKGFVFDEI